jgi:hypothetical protein
MKSASLTAASLRILLLAILLLALIGGGVGFYYVHGLLNDYAKETSELNSQAAASEKNIESLRTIKQYLATHQDDIERTQKVVAESQQFQYQNQAINAINRLAKESGIRVEKITFVGDTATAAGGAAQPQQPAPTPAEPATPVPTAGSPTGLPAAPTGPTLQSKKFDVQIESPVNYKELLKFIYLIEQNITRMQIGSVQITHSGQDDNRNTVSSNSFNIEVYVQ